jgi:hypothetical protein
MDKFAAAEEAAARTLEANMLVVASPLYNDLRAIDSKMQGLLVDRIATSIIVDEFNNAFWLDVFNALAVDVTPEAGMRRRYRMVSCALAKAVNCWASEHNRPTFESPFAADLYRSVMAKVGEFRGAHKQDSLNIEAIYECATAAAAAAAAAANAPPLPLLKGLVQDESKKDDNDDEHDDITPEQQHRRSGRKPAPVSRLQESPASERKRKAVNHVATGVSKKHKSTAEHACVRNYVFRFDVDFEPESYTDDVAVFLAGQCMDHQGYAVLPDCRPHLQHQFSDFAVIRNSKTGWGEVSQHSKDPRQGERGSRRMMHIVDSMAVVDDILQLLIPFCNFKRVEACLLASEENVKAQRIHRDYKELRPDSKTIVAMVAFQPNTRVYLVPGSHKGALDDTEPTIVTLKAGQILLMRRDLIHAGSEGDGKINTRLHLALMTDEDESTKDIQFEENTSDEE